MEQFLQRERNVLLMYEDIDEFVISSIEGFKDKKFVSVDSADKDFELDLDKPEVDEDKKDKELLEADKKDLEKFIKSVLKERIQDVKFSDRLVSSPAIVTSIITPHMRKMMIDLMAGKEDTGMGNIPMTLELSPLKHKRHRDVAHASILFSCHKVYHHLAHVGCYYARDNRR
jgi:TNF receptor-associated protein 1